jgi:hypothetical protein
VKQRKTISTWPVYLLALPAFVAIWSGWVGLGQLAGFGPVHVLPGVADDVTLNTAITLPIGMETYAAYALRVWMGGRAPARARRFARMTAVSSLVVGSLGQIGYHLMAAVGWASAPWPVVIVVSCVPVAVLGMGAGLVHLVRADEDEAEPDQIAPPAEPLVPVVTARDEIADLVAAEPATTRELWERYAEPVELTAARSDETRPEIEQGADLVGPGLSHRDLTPDEADLVATVRDLRERLGDLAGPGESTPTDDDADVWTPAMAAELIERGQVDQVAARRRSDDELWHTFGDELCREHIAAGEDGITRYRVETITDCARRQALRLIERVKQTVDDTPREVSQ